MQGKENHAEKDSCGDGKLQDGSSDSTGIKNAGLQITTVQNLITGRPCGAFLLFVYFFYKQITPAEYKLLHS